MSETSDEIVLRHQPLVRAMARGYALRGLPYADLVQEGVLGLLDAADRYDPTHGTTFGTYARYWVRHRMQRYARRNLHAVAFPQSRGVRRARRLMRRTASELEQRAGGPVSRAALAAAMGVSVEDVALARAAQRARGVRLDEGRHAVLVDRAPDPSPEEGVGREELRVVAQRLVRPVLERLDARERLIVGERTMSNDPCILRELGERLSLSAERVRQLEKRALVRVREGLARTGTLGVAQRCARQLGA